ncbi:helix-turn-helix domain-containing protein, partial [Nesterenkonia sp. K-15-9-6]|uniref:helix-turn-helix domain-containing protein n=1 Tax=Nesterenkonia sp. K-15-9-6 TaxID=3093918 RepID=UPI0040440A9D
MTIATDFGVVPEWSQGDRFRKAREMVGLSQPELAEELGISTATVSKAERGSKVRKTTLMSWAMRTGVNPVWLETGRAPSPGGDGARQSGGDDLHSSEWAPRDSNPEPAD